MNMVFEEIFRSRPAQAGFALDSRGLQPDGTDNMNMVFEEIFSPRRRASPWIAEGFSPTARGAYRIKFSNLH
jgi:hypothetical protein